MAAFMKGFQSTSTQNDIVINLLAKMIGST